VDVGNTEEEFFDSEEYDLDEEEEDGYDGEHMYSGGGDLDWDEEEDGGEFPIEDDPEDPDYNKQKELIDKAAAAAELKTREENFDPLDFMMNRMTDEDAAAADASDFMKQIEEKAKGMMLTEEDVLSEGIGEDLEADVQNVPDLMDDDPYPRHDADEINLLEADTGITDDDMERLDNAWKLIQETKNAEPWDKVYAKDQVGWEGLSNETLAEMDAALDEIGGSAYNVTRWLLYDLDFNVTNLMLAGIKHNPEAPVLFQHWYPQILTYKRYNYAKDRNFDFTWEDVEAADTSELERYYAGFGYTEIPHKAPGETGIISFEDLDEEEIRMAHFERWMTEVYNPEWDRKDFDDDEMRDEDNVFSNFFVPPQHPDLPTFEDTLDDLKEWDEEIGDDPEDLEYKNFMGQSFNYTVVKDEEFEREFRGRLVVACSGYDKDLEIAETITERMEKEFEKRIFVETRVISHAREEDNVFEVWIESYDVELIHSKKRATSLAKDWDGPVDCDEKQIDAIVDRVRFLISDDARFSYQLVDFETEY